MNQTVHQSEIKYRPEIEGLRAIAILPILLFHFGFSIFSGGFVGVDIFFVISGYLITGIILKKLENNTFTFYDFYLRRAKRILPLLFLVLAASIPFAWLLMLPSELAEFGQSLLAAGTFTANIYFKNATNYFAANSDQIPLLHIWSLAVEEQFYLIFPITVWVLSKKNIKPNIPLLIILVASFVTSVYLSHYKPTANFYFLPTRIWEFLFGSCAVLIERQFLISNKSLNQIGSIGGLILVAIGIFFLNGQTPFPGIYALFPVFGTCLIIIFAKQQNLVAQFLSLSPIRFIGKISYSLYLWHFPILVFGNFLHLRHGVNISTILLISFTFVISILSYFVIEAPARFSKIHPKSVIFTISFLCLGINLIGYSMANYTGIYKKYNAQQLEYFSKVSQANQQLVSGDFNQPQYSVCDGNSVEKPCNLNPDAKNGQIVLFGDSHAFTLFYQLAKELRNKDIGVKLQLQGNCPPIWTSSPEMLADKCLDRNNQIYKKLLSDPKLKTIVIFARWSWYLEGIPFDNGKGGVGEKYNDFLINHYSNSSERRDLFENLYRETFNQLKNSGKEIIIVNTVPEPGWNVPKQILNLLYSNDRFDDIYYDLRLYKRRNSNVDHLLEIYRANDLNVKVIDPSYVFCNASTFKCSLTVNNIPLYTDDNHVSELGAHLIAQEIVKKILY